MGAHAGPTPSPYGGAMPSSPYASAYAGNGSYSAGFQSMGQSPYGGFRAGYGAGVAPAYGAQPSTYGASPSFQTPGGNTYGAGYTAGANPYTDTRAAGANPYAGLYAGRGVQPVNTLAFGSAQRYATPAATSFSAQRYSAPAAGGYGGYSAPAQEAQQSPEMKAAIEKADAQWKGVRAGTGEWENKMPEGYAAQPGAMGNPYAGMYANRFARPVNSLAAPAATAAVPASN